MSSYFPGLAPEGLDLMEKMLVHNPNARISAKEAMKHPYLADVPDAIKNMKWATKNCPIDIRQYINFMHKFLKTYS